ncbi:hypothetical protein [Aurantimonas coralicida]|uniref:hypothetical protein n=1 Tax=Aurantimonas coralicida TaxID=182270 RepID=UPI001E2C66D6|nr:hypothetical protein [Aurantimonas coralicida]MCD1644816.1 hypothetical protein [Aurantimonas coralicida]
MEALPFPVVRQRSGNDCMVASFATVTGRTYEESAKLLDIALDPVTRAVDPQMEGLAFYKMGPASLRIGLSATQVFCPTPHLAATQDKVLNGVSGEELRAMIKGRDAVLCVAGIKGGRFVGHHAVAWKDGRLVDCGDCIPPGTSLEDSGAYMAVIIAPLPPAASKLVEGVHDGR